MNGRAGGRSARGRREVERREAGGRGNRRRSRARRVTVVSGLLALALLVSVLVAAPMSGVGAQVNPNIPVYPTVTLGPGASSVKEGNPIDIAVVADQDVQHWVAAVVEVDHGSAEYADTCNTLYAIARIAPGENTDVVTIPTCADSDSDPETLTLRLGQLSRATMGTPNTFAVTITENTDPPTVTLSAPSSVDEGQPVTVTATLSYAVSDFVRVPVTLTADTAEPGDFTPLWGFVFRPGEATATLRIPTKRDDDVNDDTFKITLGTLPSTVRGPSPAQELTVNIADIDAARAIISITAPETVAEGQPVTVTANLANALLVDVTVPVTVTLGTAEAGDIRAPARFTIRARSTSATFRIATRADGDSDDETFTVTLGDLPEELVRGTSSAVVTITDSTPRVNLSVSPEVVMEGRSATLTVTLSSPVPRELSFPLTITRVTAEEGDLLANNPVVVIPANRLSGSLDLLARHDSDRQTEALVVSLDSLPAGTVGVNTVAPLTISDDDALVAVRGADPDDGFFYVGENSTKNIYVSLTGRPNSNVTATVSITAGGSHATVSSGASITFTSNDYRAKKVVIRGTNDSATTYLDDATLRFSFASSDARFDETIVDRTVKVVDDDAPFTLWLEHHTRPLTVYERGKGNLIPVVVKASRRVPEGIPLAGALREVSGYLFRADRDDYRNSGGYMRAGTDTAVIALQITDDNIVEAVKLGKLTLTISGYDVDSNRNTLDVRLIDDDTSRVYLQESGGRVLINFSKKFYTDVDLWVVGWNDQLLVSPNPTLYQGTTLLNVQNMDIEQIKGIVIRRPADKVSGGVTGTDGWNSDWIEVGPGFAVIGPGGGANAWQSATFNGTLEIFGTR